MSEVPLYSPVSNRDAAVLPLMRAHMREGSTPFGACEVRCWRWLFGNKIPVSHARRCCAAILRETLPIVYRGTSLISNRPPP